MQQVIIIIPIYKSEPNNSEIIALRQCLSILNKYPIIFVVPKTFDNTFYLSVVKEYDVQYKFEKFSDSYFESISGYNSLLLSKAFYERFSTYEYMLIYQLDAYVFRDELSEWCNKAYDYIGAPLVGRYEEQKYHIEMNLRVGNGGFSLRKISFYLDYYEGNKNVFSSKQISNRISLKEKPYTRIFVWVFMMLGWRNKPKSVADHWKYNEDDFWSGLLSESNYSPSKPYPIEALNFAFERFPSSMFDQTKTIPFGCHAWKKYEYDSFWKKYIS
ncbi:MAG TPA: DUF5672 family protein [Paludibacteraceae bacterium]|nr:DUF5672 family protein [Paludibacteraceae bacterium]